MQTSDALTELRGYLRGEPVFLVGSAVAEVTYGLTAAHDDIDVFCPSIPSLIAAATKLETRGFQPGKRFDRVWDRWKKWGMDKWHTNSLKLEGPEYEVNFVFKKVGGHTCHSLATVLESFDFGLLAMGWDVEADTFRDMRGYLFPDLPADGPLPLMPNKRSDWTRGFLSQYNGLREAGRYVKYHDYGYDMSRVREDLITGYYAAAEALADRDNPEKKTLAEIYQRIATSVQDGTHDELREMAKLVKYTDSLDAIMDSLE